MGGVVVFIITEHSQERRMKKYDSPNQKFIKFHLWIMMKHWILLNFFILSLGSCVQEPSDKSLVTPKYIKWEVVLPENDDFITIYNPIIFEDLVIIPIEEQGVLLALDKGSGEEIWRWTEARDTYNGADGFGEKNYIYDGVLVTSQNNLTYGIDVTNGETLWHDRNIDSGASFVYGYDQTFVKMFNEYREFRSLRIGDVLTGEMEEVYRFEREDSLNISSNIPMLFEHNGNILSTFNKIKALSTVDGYFQNSWVNLFDINTKDLLWTTDSIPKEYQLDVTAGLRPIYHRGKILMCNRSIYAYDVDTGKLDWWNNSHSNTFAWSTYLTAADGKVFGNNENGYMIALDVETGAELWRTDTGGTGSRIEHHDEKLYIAQITGYYSEELNAYSPKSSLLVLDANTGEVLHHLQSPYEDDGDHRYWDDIITVDQETGLIYTADHKKVMCIELDD